MTQTGERLVLPEGDAESAKALVKFAQLDGTLGLLGKGYDRFDLRDPTKLVVRMKHATPNEVEDDGSDNQAAAAPLTDAD